jgi:hypothetical protein
MRPFGFLDYTQAVEGRRGDRGEEERCTDSEGRKRSRAGVGILGAVRWEANDVTQG